MTHLISYAQNFEDVMLWRALGHIERGRYVDVGAQSPDVDSVSRVFYEHGWRGVHVEPVAMYAEQLRGARPDEMVIQAAVSETAGILTVFEFAATGLSTTHDEIAARHVGAGFTGNEAVVAAITLDDVLARASAGGVDVHWLKIDIEGGEHDALRGWKNNSVLPWIVVIESTLPLTQAESYLTWEPLLLEKGYQFAYFDGLNRFYVSPEQPGLLDSFKAGPNIFDGFALSGTASSPFCSRVNDQMKTLQEEAATALEASLQQLVRTGKEHAERIAELQAINAQLEHTSAVERAAVEQRLLALAEQIGDARQREQELSSQLTTSLQRELGLSEQMSAAMERELRTSAQLLQNQEQLTEERNAHQASRTQRQHERDVHALQVGRLKSDLESMHSEYQLAKTQLQHQQESAHTWWRTAEELRQERNSILGSHSWRLTAPLRNLRRGASKVRASARRCVRAIVVGVMRGVVATEVLRRPATALLGLQPSLKRRLRRLAVHERMIESGDSATPVMTSNLPGDMTSSNEGPGHAPALSRQAQRVLEDLRHAIRGRQN